MPKGSLQYTGRDLRFKSLPLNQLTQKNTVAALENKKATAPLNEALGRIESKPLRSQPSDLSKTSFAKKKLGGKPKALPRFR